MIRKTSTWGLDRQEMVGYEKTVQVFTRFFGIYLFFWLIRRLGDVRACVVKALLCTIYIHFIYFRLFFGYLHGAKVKYLDSLRCNCGFFRRDSKRSLRKTSNYIVNYCNNFHPVNYFIAEDLVILTFLIHALQFTVEVCSRQICMCVAWMCYLLHF